MTIKAHTQVLNPYTFVRDSATTVRDKLNENFSLLKGEIQGSKDKIEDAISSLSGNGFLEEPEISYSGASLQINFSEFRCLFGKEIAYVGGNATVLPSQTGGVLYFLGDLTWDTEEPEDEDFFIAAIYDSDSDGVTDVSLTPVTRLFGTNGIVEIEDTVEVVVDAEVGEVDEYIDHSTDYSFVIPGFIGVYSADADFTVEVMSYPNVLADSDYPDSPPKGNTESGFWVHVEYNGATPTGNVPVNITYKRSGF